MTHHRFEFLMPATAAIVFDAFHHQHWRVRWDLLVGTTLIQGGALCPFLGAITQSTGAGMLRGVSMRTQFISFERPHLAAATMLEPSFPFTRWAASMRHQGLNSEESLLIYTYNFEVGPPALRWLMQPVVKRIFNWQTCRRFKRLRDFLALHAGDVAKWQLQNAVSGEGISMLSAHEKTPGRSQVLSSPSGGGLAQSERPGGTHELKLLRYSLVFVWLATAWVSVWELHGQSLQLLTAAGVQNKTLALILIGCGDSIDAALGLAMCIWPVRLTYLLALMAMVIMTLVATVIAPHLWLHPLGPLIKNVPIAVALWMLAKAKP